MKLCCLLRAIIMSIIILLNCVAIGLFIYSLGSDEIRAEARLIVSNASERKESQSQFILFGGGFYQSIYTRINRTTFFVQPTDDCNLCATRGRKQKRKNMLCQVASERKLWKKSATMAASGYFRMQYEMSRSLCAVHAQHRDDQVTVFLFSSNFERG